MQTNQLKIYVQDRGVYGSIMVIAKNEEQAHEMMVGEANYIPDDELEVFEVKEGFVFSNLGDK